MNPSKRGDSSLVGLMISNSDASVEIKRALTDLVSWEIGKLDVSQPQFQNKYREVLNREAPPMDADV